MKLIGYFDLLKAFGYIETDFFFSRKTYFTLYVRNMFWDTILYQYHIKELLLNFEQSFF